MVDAPVRQPTLGEALALIYRSVRQDLRPCISLSVPYAILIGGFVGFAKSLSLKVGPEALTVSEVAVTGVAIFIALGVSVLVNAVGYALTLGALSVVGSAEVYGDAIDAGRIRRRVFDQAADAIAAFVLSLLVLALAPVGVGIVSVLVAAIARPVTGFGVLLFAIALLIVPELYVAVRLSLAVPVVIREGLRPRDALRRSWELVHGAHWLWAFAVELVVFVIAFGTYYVLDKLAGLAHATGFVEFVLYLVVDGAIAAFGTMIVGLAAGVIYASLAPEGAHAPPEVGAHEVLPEELPPLQS